MVSAMAQVLCTVPGCQAGSSQPLLERGRPSGPYGAIFQNHSLQYHAAAVPTFIWVSARMGRHMASMATRMNPIATSSTLLGAAAPLPPLPAP